MSRPPYVSPYLFLVFSSTTESSEEVNTIESLPIRSEPQIAQKPIYFSTTEISEELSKIDSFPILSEPQIVQKPILSSKTEFQLERRISEESRKIESLPQRAEKPWEPQMSSVGSSKLSPLLCHCISLLFFYSLYRI